MWSAHPGGLLNVVTGAFGFIGRAIARALLDSGEAVRTITTHPDKPNPFGKAVSASSYNFHEPEELVATLRGATTLYNTYWIRFEHGGMTFEQTVRNTRLLFESARDAGVGRIVHIGVTNASMDSGLAYYRGKALQEKALIESGLSHAIVRPTLVFGSGEILVNNIAWLLRRFPYFPIGGSGRYRLQPVHVDDVAAIAIACAKESGTVTVDAIGPEAYTFDEFVRLIASTVRPSARLIHLPPGVVAALGRLVGLGLGDVILTRAELQGLMDEMLTSKEAPNGSVRFSEWIAKHREEVGAAYASELGRHFDWKGNPSDRAA